MNIEKEKKSNNKIILLIITVILFGVIGLYLINIKNQEKDYTNVVNTDKVKVYSKNTNQEFDWNNSDTIVVDAGNIDAELYSFDGGLNWQESNEYTTTNNGKFDILIKDKNGNTTNAISYTINNIDNTAPVIEVTLPSKISKNEVINLQDYATATDDLSGINGEIIISPRNLDTTILGSQIINYSIKDKAGNKTSINVSVEIVEPAELNENTDGNQNNDNNSNDSNNENNTTNLSTTKNTILYRYRVKKANSYTCKTYDCSYYSDADKKEPTQTYTSTGKCNDSYNIKITFNNGCIIIPVSSEASCTQAFTTVERYSLINNQYIDIIALLKDGTQKQSYGTSNSLSQNKTNSNSSSVIETTYSEYKKEPCGKNETAINGYCHAICSVATKTCPSGYQLTDGVCKKYVSKTCTDTCTSYTWSSWSEWSETKIISSDEIQVETKIN